VGALAPTGSVSGWRGKDRRLLKSGFEKIYVELSAGLVRNDRAGERGESESLRRRGQMRPESAFAGGSDGLLLPPARECAFPMRTSYTEVWSIQRKRWRRGPRQATTSLPAL
jgi:hypothetical protein